MTTIPQRLREIANHIHECGLTKDSRRLKGIAAELEAPAADAVAVVGYLYEDEHGNQYLHQARNTAWIAPPQSLIRQRDHLATVAALQARITELERQKEIDVEQGNVSVAHYSSVLRQLSDAQARINELESRQLPEGSIPITRQSLAELIQDGYMAGAKRGVETAVTDLLARGWKAPQSSHPDTGKDAP